VVRSAQTDVVVRRWIADFVAEILRTDTLDQVVDRLDTAIVRQLPELADRDMRRDLAASTRAHALVMLGGLTQDRMDYPVPPEAHAFARTVARRGHDLRLLLRVYHFGQEAVLDYMTETLEKRHPPPDIERAVLLRLFERSSLWVSSSVEALTGTYMRERERGLRAALNRRTEIVGALLEGANPDVDAASARLGYRLSDRHIACVLWTDEQQPNLALPSSHPVLRAGDPATLGTDAVPSGSNPVLLSSAAARSWSGPGSPSSAAARSGTGSGLPSSAAVRSGSGSGLSGSVSVRSSDDSSLSESLSVQRGSDSSLPGSVWARSGSGSGLPSSAAARSASGSGLSGSVSVRPGGDSGLSGSVLVQRGGDSSLPGSGWARSGSGSGLPSSAAVRSGSGSGSSSSDAVRSGSGSGLSGSVSVQRGGDSSLPGSGWDRPGSGSGFPGSVSARPGGDSGVPGGDSSLSGSVVARPGSDSVVSESDSGLPGADSVLPGGDAASYRGMSGAFAADPGDDEVYGTLERVVARLASALGGGGVLTIPSGASALWAWIAVEADVDPGRLPVTVEAPVRIAVGGPAAQIAGFRQSHREAVAARQVAERAVVDLGRVVRYSQVETAYLAGADEPAMRALIDRELGALARPGAHAARLRETLHTYLRCRRSPDATAKELGVHRNTVRYRLQRITELLGRPIDERGLRLELALDCAAVYGIPGHR
jgi:hypothetical protein